jgi:GT2 family glycosyltransferase
MLRDPTVGICASKLLFDGNGSINSAGDGLTTGAVGFNRGLGKDAALYNQSEYVFGACGAAVLYRRRMLEEIGFLDEEFFLYDEDTDLNFRAQLAGWKCVYVPEAIVYHKGNATAGRLSDMHVYYHTRNLEFVWLKNMPFGLMLRYLHHKFFQEFGSFCYLCLRHGKWRPYFRAKMDAVKLLPTMWKKRQAIQAQRRVSNSYVSALMTSMFSLDFARQKLRQLIRG